MCYHSSLLRKYMYVPLTHKFAKRAGVGAVVGDTQRGVGMFLDVRRASASPSRVNGDAVWRKLRGSRLVGRIFLLVTNTIIK